jgi:hypothetical protein
LLRKDFGVVIYGAAGCRRTHGKTVVLLQDIALPGDCPLDGPLIKGEKQINPWGEWTWMGSVLPSHR